MAKNLARTLGGTDIIMMRSEPAVTDVTEAQRAGFVFSYYGGATVRRERYHNPNVTASELTQTMLHFD